MMGDLTYGTDRVDLPDHVRRAAAAKVARYVTDPDDRAEVLAALGLALEPDVGPELAEARPPAGVEAGYRALVGAVLGAEAAERDPRRATRETTVTTCPTCDHEMSVATSCDVRVPAVRYGDEPYLPDPVPDRCRDCGVTPGGIHHPRCCIEICGVAGHGQRLTCPCGPTP